MSEVKGEERMLIDGRLVAAATGATYHNINPATEEVIGVAADGGGQDMGAAIAAARRTFDGTDWSVDQRRRVRCVRQLHEALTKHSDELRAVTVAEVGCPVALTFGPQLDSPIAGVEWVAGIAESYEWEGDLGTAEPFGIRSRRYIRREPVGVGPVLTVVAHDGDDDAVAIANGTRYGLSGSVFSGSLDRARAVAQRVLSGTMSINGGFNYGADVPFGAYRQSGIGREMGVPGFEEYLEIKAVAEPA